MPNKKGSHWKKPKVNPKKMSIYLTKETGEKIDLLSNLIQTAKKSINKTTEELERETPSGIASQIVEKNISSYFNETVNFLNKMFEDNIKKKANS